MGTEFQVLPETITNLQQHRETRIMLRYLLFWLSAGLPPLCLAIFG